MRPCPHIRWRLRSPSARNRSSPHARRIQVDACGKFEVLVVDYLRVELAASPGQKVEAEVRILADRKIHVGAHDQIAVVPDLDATYEMRQGVGARELVHCKSRIVGMADHQLGASRPIRYQHVVETQSD